MPSPRSPSRAAANAAHGRRERRRRAIIVTAAKLFARSGYDACDMERVAQRARVAKGTLYLYFAGKQELFFACVDEAMRQMQDAIRAAAGDADDPFEQIARAVRAYLTFFDEHPEYVELLIQERAIFRDRKQSTYFKHRAAARGYWRELYADLIRQGRLRGDLPVEAMLDTIGQLVYGTMFTNHFAGRKVPIAEQQATLLNVVFRGILSDRERRRGDRATSRPQRRAAAR